MQSMGLFNTFFSRSSEHGNSKSSETRRSWTWVGRTQSGGVSLQPHKTDSPPEAASDELEETQPDSTIKENISKSQDRLKSEVTPPEYLKHGPELENPTTRPTDSTVAKEAGVSSHISSTESKRSMRGSRGIAGFMTLLRSRKPRHQKSVFELSKTPGQHETYIRGKSSDWGNNNNRDNEQSVNQRSDLGQTLQFNINLNEDPESRKVSDKTVQSVDSDLTNVTVCRRPSKRTSTPIAIVDREYISQNPFDDLLETSNSVTNPNPFTDQSKITERSSRQPSSNYSDTSSRSIRNPVVIERPRNPIIQNGSFLIGSLSRESSFPTSSSNDSTWSSHIDQHKAAIAFNELASKLNLDPLILSDSDDEGVEFGHAHPIAASYDSAEERLPRRRDRIFGRIRTMRSTIHIRTQPVPQDRKLRRMKTFAGLSSRSCGMDSLKGKSLETLARLGGHSLLALPGDFAPSSLKLPVCFVATATYLRCCAPPVRHLFVDPGDLKTATRTYEYFASQVLSAEKEQDKIQMTMRSSEMSSDLMGILNLNASGRSSTRVLSVAWAFKALLAGLPGGILGSMRLYHVLVNIYNRRISECQLQRTKSCLGGLSATGYAKIKAIGLTILALTSSMQLELICAVFGLCAVLLHETGRMIEMQRQGSRGAVGRPGFASGLLDLDRLSRVFGPLLTGSYQDDAQGAAGPSECEIECRRVAAMLIGNWRGVSRQLRIWESQGHTSRVVMSWTSCGDKSLEGSSGQ